MIALQTRIVAFIDLLGYKDMVLKDSQGAANDSKFVDKLYAISNEIKPLVNKEADVTFFSDCIALSGGMKFENFHDLCIACRRIQSHLLSQGILARGGISFGKHFRKSDFLFSQGLVDAYFLENAQAKVPRIIVSPDLIELFRNENVSFLVKERDGLFFIDYIDSTNNDVIQTIQTLIDIGISNPVIADKLFWLAEYANFRFKHDAIKIPTRFTDAPKTAAP